jgi:hypothetical protein
MKMKQRIRLLALVCAVCVTCAAAAQDKFPTKAVTIIVPQTPGGANDVLARLLAQKLTENLGQQFIVENRPGAGGNIGTVYAAKAPKDGYTWMLTANSVIIVNPALYKNPGFDPNGDFAPVTPMAGVPYLWVANPSFAANSIKELIDMAKARPGSIAYASAGNGTPNHLLGEMFKAQAGVDLLHVPQGRFRGSDGRDRRASARVGAKHAGGNFIRPCGQVEGSCSGERGARARAPGCAGSQRNGSWLRLDALVWNLRASRNARAHHLAYPRGGGEGAGRQGSAGQDVRSRRRADP